MKKYLHQDVVTLTPKQVFKLQSDAGESLRKRSRICLHRDTNEFVQEMVICFTRDSYVRPHRHKHKSESFHIIQGDLYVVLFNNQGKIYDTIRMSTFAEGKIFLYRLNTGLWHTVIPLSEFVILHETRTGPFVKKEEDYASWSPQESEFDKIRVFISQIRKKIDN